MFFQEFTDVTQRLDKYMDLLSILEKKGFDGEGIVFSVCLRTPGSKTWKGFLNMQYNKNKNMFFQEFLDVTPRLDKYMDLLTY